MQLAQPPTTAHLIADEQTLSIKAAADPLDPGEFEKAVEQFLSPRQWAIFSEQGSVDVGADLNEQTSVDHGITRYRFGRSFGEVVFCNFSEQSLDYL